ncbi:MAG: hypothetical protein HC911_18170, partial [Chloroflexaceae bacterium]|nr:hypothetical protein [Chloroflexaceae bacterium]
PITPPPPPRPAVRRFYGRVTLDPQRVARDANQIAEELIQHLVGTPGATVTVQIEITADLPAGAPEHTKRTVSENARQLKFTTFGFEEG